MISFFISVFAFVFGLGILITFHEFGHFWVARRMGVKVLRFSIGFGKPIFRWYGKDGVEYVIALLPLGGYVKMLDASEGPIPSGEEHLAFSNKSVFKRILIVLAGPGFNFIFAIFAYWLMFMIGIMGLAPIIGEVTPDSIADRAGLKPKMEIVAVDNQPTQTWQGVVNALIPRLGDSDTLILKATDSNTKIAKEYKLELKGWEVDSKDPNLIEALGLDLFMPEAPAIILDVVEGGPADKAGLMPDDKIIGINHQSANTIKDAIEGIQKHPNQKIQITVLRNLEQLHVDITPDIYEGNHGKQEGVIGVMLKPIDLPNEFVRLERFSAGESFTRALDKTWYFSVLSLKLMGKMLTGKVGVENLSGPISIAQGAGETAERGIAYYLGFLALISLSLGVLNLLPIPVLDGGHLLFYTFEIIFRRPLPEKYQIVAYKIGLACIIGLMVIAFYNDIVRLG